MAAPPKPVAPRASASKPGAMAPAGGDPAKSKGKFTLHLNTFATADDASAFAQRYPGAFVDQRRGPGARHDLPRPLRKLPVVQGRDRAKDSFEKQHGTIALVAAR